jgi:hypothetical protein
VAPAAPAPATVTRASSDSLTPEGWKTTRKRPTRRPGAAAGGDFDQAVRTADHALVEIEAILAGDIDALGVATFRICVGD